MELEFYEAIVVAKGAAHWTYLPYGPFASATAFHERLAKAAGTADPLFFSIVSQASGQAQGFAAYQRINPESGAIEVGHVSFGRPLERTGRSRDTAWHSVIDAEWPLLRDALERWLSPSNFDEHGRQRASLRALG